MTNLIEDIANLTSVSEVTLQKLLDISNYSISHALYEALVSGKNVAEIDLDFGSLFLYIESNQIRYKFIPSKELEKLVIETVKTRKSPIVTKLNTKLQDKINRTYKDLL